MVFLYSLAITVYFLGILIASLINRKARLWIRGRRNIFDEIKEQVKQSDNLFWFHASSLGEFEQGRPLIETIKKKYNSVKILLTFFSPSGYEIRKNYQNADYIFYLPIDTKRNALKFLKLIGPAKAFFIKYEFWYHYLDQLNKLNIPVYLISAKFRQEQIFFRFYGKWFRNMLLKFAHIFVQDKSSERLLKIIGLNDVTISGDTRFDRVAELAKQSKKIEIVEKFKQDSTIIIAGSTWEKDEALIIEFINNTSHKLKYIIAPHEIYKSNIQRISNSIKKPSVLYSASNIDNVSKFEVLIIDNIGMLASLYKYADIAYIGGGFGIGIHNILEAATFGLPVVFGTKYKKFKEAVDLVSLGGAFSICGYTSLKKQFEDLLEMRKRNYAGGISEKYVLENQGATSIILERIKP